MNFSRLLAFFLCSRRPRGLGERRADGGARRRLLEHRLESRIKLAEVVPQPDPIVKFSVEAAAGGEPLRDFGYAT